MRNYMYLRPGNLYKDFLIETNKVEIGTTGRVKTQYEESETRMIKGILAEADERQKIRFSQLGHPVTHTIIQEGGRKAKPEDKLVLGDRVFLIKGVEEAGSLGIATMYYAEERMDVK